MNGTTRCILLGFAAMLAGPLHAADTAFWKPYEPDAATFYLEHFDREGAPPGRFGGAHQGPAPHIQTEPRLLVGGALALESWVKLAALPKERAYAIRRAHGLNRTTGFELFIEPSGAFGLALVDCGGDRLELKSETGLVPPGQWIHLAALANDAYVLYVNGQEVKRVPRQSGMPRIDAEGQKESVAAPVIVGAGVPGLLDEVRVHTAINKFWPQPQQPWIAARAAAPLPPAETVLAPGHAAVLHVPFDGDLSAAVNLKGARIVGNPGGVYVDGVRGKAFRGTFTVSGPLAGAEQGAIEFWCRPVGINNYSDRNVTLCSNSLFNFYLLNTARGFRPLTLYYADAEKKLHFAGDNRGTEVYPGKWTHYLLTWGSGKVEWYANGEKAGGSDANFAARDLSHLNFNPQRLFGDVDELYVYDQALGAVEAANCYWRYVDPAHMQKARASLASLRFWHLPSSHELYAQIRAESNAVANRPVRIQLQQAGGKMVFSAAAVFSPEPQRFILPELESGDYAINLRVGEEETDPQTLKRQKFAWEKDRLGITEEVFAPFTPVRTAGDRVSVVLREQRMNRFGLWDSVVSKGKELLAAPMALVAIDENNNDLDWRGSVAMASATPHVAVYRATSVCPAVAIEATSAIEMDGMMRVRLKLNPVEKPVALRRLSLEIPLKDDLVPLLHESTDIIRAAYAGVLPAGDGEIWNSKQSNRQPAWLNAFTSYIWMGGPERGLAWFAENDKGWITAKNYDAPLMHIRRENGRVTLRVDLVNVPGPLAKPTELVFGIQASPTRPVPADYRSKAITLGGVGLPVHPWGGLSCSWKSPWMDRWEVVDKVIQGRNGGTVDRAWFERFEKQFDVPKVHGIQSWLDDVCRFASTARPLTSPDPVYFEEMYVLPFIPEYHVFQDEWSTERLAERSTASVDVYRNSGGHEVNPNASTNYSPSYQDYCLSLMNQWMQRGVSMYWDNTYLKLATNPWTSAAYVCSDGRTQPATVLWNERQYMQRTWNLMNQWRRKGVPRPLEFVAHMTNEQILPLFSWSTCNYDIEMSQSAYARAFPDSYQPGEPYMPAFLLAESTGLQVGAYPYIVHHVFEDQCNLPPEAIGAAPGPIEIGRREWGMRMVHEIIRGGPNHWQLPGSTLDKAVYAFGYGGKAVTVWNYWSDTPAFTIDNQHVKAILLTRPADRKMLLVLQSWSKTPVTAAVAFLPNVIGFKPGTHVYDAFGNRHLRLDAGTLTARLDFPYETAVYVIDDRPPEPGTLFRDDFAGGLNPGWDYVSPYAALQDGAVRLGENRAPWQGSPRLFKWLGLPEFRDAALGFSFRIERIPEQPADVLVARFPARGVEWSKHGLSHSDVKGGLSLLAHADPVKGFVWRATCEREGKTSVLGEGISGAVDTAVHRVEVSLAGSTYCVSVDGKRVVSAAAADILPGSAFGITARGNPAATIGALVLGDIVLRCEKTDDTFLNNQRQAALARAREIVAAQFDELKGKIVTAFGTLGHRPIYNLAMFRSPEADVAQLGQLLKSETEPGRSKVLLAVLRELPKRQQEHVQGMKAIGQPPRRLEEFQRARKQAIDFLRRQTSATDSTFQAAIAETIAALETTAQNGRPK